MSCRIQIDNPGIYFPGNNITGKVICRFEHQENIRGIRCKLRGIEHTSWTEKRGKHHTRFTGEQIIVAGDTCFIGEGKINAGVYEYPFNFSLPPANIPSSYQHPLYGFIRYFISVNVDRPFAFDYHSEVGLHVETPINFFQLGQPTQMTPRTYQTEKQTGCCRGGTNSLDVVLEKTAFVVGDDINITVHIENLSNVDIHKVVVHLVSTVQFTTLTPDMRQKIEKNILAGAFSDGVAARSERTFPFDIKIPETALIPSFLGCTLFRHWCTILVEAVFPGFISNLTLEIPVQLAHASLENNASSSGFTNILAQPLGPAVYPIRNTTIQPSAPNIPPENIPSAPKQLPTDQPLPSYDEAVKY